MFANIIFIFSYAFYFFIFLNNTGKIIYPLILAPFIVYLFMFAASFYVSKINKQKFIKIFSKISKFLFIFFLLFLSSFILKINIPEPHNFTMRKLELMLGVIYILFLVCVFMYAIYVLTEKFLQFEKEDLFKNIVLILTIQYFFISLWFNYANQPTGDEPVYLLVSHSIVYDRDIDLKNNYEKKDYKNFYEKELQLQELNIEGKIYSYHPVFYSLLISPFYLVGKRLGVTIFSNILAGFLIGFLFLLILEVLKDKKIAVLTATLAGFSMPFLVYINQICTEVLNGLLILISFYLINFNKNRFLSICLITSLIPWAHSRNLVIWAILVIIFIFENKNAIKKILKFILTQIISITLLFAFNYIHYKAFLPRQTAEDISFFKVFNFNINGLLGILFDQEFGLFFYTPIFIFIFAGAYFLYKENKKLFYYFALLLLPYYLFVGSWILWNAGGGASNRFFVPVIFIFFVFISQLFIKIKEKYSKIILNFLVATGLFISLIIMLIPWFRWNKGMGENWILKIFSEIFHIKLSILFPSLWYMPEKNVIQIFFWLVLIIVLNIFLLKINKKDEN